jgi:hypothetical protein
MAQKYMTGGASLEWKSFKSVSGMVELFQRLAHQARKIIDTVTGCGTQ